MRVVTMFLFVLIVHANLSSQTTSSLNLDSIQLTGNPEIALKHRQDHLRLGRASEVDSLKYLGNLAIIKIDKGEYEEGMALLDSLWSKKGLLENEKNDLKWLSETLSYYYGLGLQMRGYKFSKGIADTLMMALDDSSLESLKAEKMDLTMDLRYLAKFNRDYVSALKYQTNFFEMSLNQDMTDTLDLVVSYNNTASFYSDLSELAKAKLFYRKAYELSLISHDQKDPFEHINTSGNYLNELLDYGDYLGAKKVALYLESNKDDWAALEGLGQSIESVIIQDPKVIAKLYILLPLVRYYAHIHEVPKANQYFNQMVSLVSKIKVLNCEMLEPFFLAVLKMEMVWGYEKIDKMQQYADLMRTYDCSHNASVQEFMIGRKYFEEGEYKAMEDSFGKIEILGENYFEVFKSDVFYYNALKEKSLGNSMLYLDYLSQSLGLNANNKVFNIQSDHELQFDSNNSIRSIKILNKLAIEVNELFLNTGNMRYKAHLCSIQRELLNRFQKVYDRRNFTEQLYKELTSILDLVLDNNVCGFDLKDLLVQLEQVHSQKLRNSLLGNKLQATSFDFKEDIRKIRKDIRKMEKDKDLTLVDDVDDENTKDEQMFEHWSINELQKRIKKNELIVRYFLGDQYVYGFAIANNSVSLKKLGSKKDIVAAIKENRDLIYHRSSDFMETSKLLYKLLLQPMLIDHANLKLLRIITEDELSYLNIAALITPSGNYVIQENYALSYDFSLPILMARQDKKPVKSDVLVFSPTYSNQGDVTQSYGEELVRSSEMLNLPFAATEGKAIAAIFEGKHITGVDATKYKLKAEGPNFDVVHLAMHAITSEDKKQLESALLFGEGDLFSFNEIKKLNLKCSLVTVSACSSGIGNLEEGEDLQSLSQAFTYAGANATVTSLWNINDSSTSAVMIEFYRNLKQGLNKASSMQLAQRSYFNKYASADKQLAHPYYWSAFTVGGNIDPVLFKEPLNLYVIGGLILCAIVSLIFFVIKSNYNSPKRRVDSSDL